MKVVKSPPGRGGISRILYLVAFILQLFILSNNVYAEDNYVTSISVESEPFISWQVSTGAFSTLDYPISVTTNSPYGYTLRFEALGDSNELESSHGEEFNLPSITLPNGMSSLPGALILNGYGYSLDGGTNFLPIPEANGGGDIIASPTETVPQQVNEHNITFGMKVDSSYVSGRYTKSFLVTAIATSPITCETGYICYMKNGVIEGRELDDQEVTNASDTMLQAPPFKRDGFGFAGWNTMPDGSGTNYGPNESIAVDTTLSGGLILFANWVQSSGNLQGFTGCENMSFGDVIALTDNRDGNTYAITRMSDGGCWMMENLRLDLSDDNLTITAANTNNPTTNFMNAINNSANTSSNSFCSENSNACIDQVKFNNNNIDLESDTSYVSYGAYYNWYTATAGNGRGSYPAANVAAAGDLCPAGWRLPTGVGDDSDFVLLDIALGGTGVNATTSAGPKRWRKYPANFVYSGQYKANAQVELGVSGNFIGSQLTTHERASNVWMLADKINFNNNGGQKYRGQSMRCVMKNSYTVKFDTNVPDGVVISGDMPDQVITRDVNKKLRKNTFTHTYSNYQLYRFLNWNTEADGSGDSYDDEEEVSNLAATGEEITLYAQWEIIQYANLEVIFDENAITEFSIVSSDYGSATITSSGGTAEIAVGKTYMISFDMDVGYVFNRYTTTENGQLGDATVSPTTYIVISGDATLTIETAVRDTTLYIQNLSSSVCSSTPKVAVDIRDGEEYLVQRLADGNCWMIDDLRLGGYTITNAISSENTNISENTTFTVPASSSLNTNYTLAQINTTGVGDVINHFGDTSGKRGVYYNFCAASAGTVCAQNSPQAATEDICPAGWRLPTGGVGGEQETLFNQFGNIAGMQTGASLTYGGWYTTASGGSVKEFETASWTWSSTPSNATNKSYTMFIGRTKKSFDVGQYEYYGMNIRCVLK